MLDEGAHLGLEVSGRGKDRKDMSVGKAKLREQSHEAAALDAGTRKEARQGPDPRSRHEQIAQHDAVVGQDARLHRECDWSVGSLERQSGRLIGERVGEAGVLVQVRQGGRGAVCLQVARCGAQHLRHVGQPPRDERRVGKLGAHPDRHVEPCPDHVEKLIAQGEIELEPWPRLRL